MNLPDIIVEQRKSAMLEYVKWRKAWVNDDKSAAQARSCFEYVLKALIAKECNILTFDESSFNQLKKGGFIAHGFVYKQFSFGVCVHVFERLKNHPLQFNVVLKSALTLGNDAVHKRAGMMRLEDRTVLNNGLYEIFGYFFRAIEPNPNWEQQHVIPFLDAPAEAFSDRIFDIVTKKLEPQKVNHGNSFIRLINSEYWDTLRRINEAQRNHIYEEFLFRSDEEYTRDYISLVGSDPNSFCDSVKNLPLQIFRGDQEDESTIAALIEECFRTAQRSLIKIFAPSGEGKTVFLSKVAYTFSNGEIDAYEVYWLSRLSEEIVANICSLLIGSSKKTLIFVDTPSRYEDERIPSWSQLSQAGRIAPFIVITCDQKNRYDKALSNSQQKDFETPFQEVVRVDFMLHPRDRLSALAAVEAAIKIKYPDVPDKNTIGFHPKPTHSIRENIRQYIKTLGLKNHVKHKDDWDIFKQLTNDAQYRQFSDLFPFVALFSYHDVGVPIEIFSSPYVRGVSASDVLGFLNRDKQNIIRLSETNHLVLRHEDIARWYYEVDSRKERARYLYIEFVNTFHKHTDLAGAYLFRNTYHVLSAKFKSILSGIILEHSPKSLFEIFIQSNTWNDRTRVEISKCLMRLSFLERNPDLSLSWLDQILKNDPKEYRAITRKISLLIQADRYQEAAEHLIFTKQEQLYDEYLFLSEVRLHRKLQRDVPYGEMFQEVVGKADLLKYLLGNNRMDVIMELAPCLSSMPVHSIGDDRTLHDMFMATYYFNALRYDDAIDSLNSILSSNPKDVHARILLYKVYVHAKEWSMAEQVILDGMTILDRTTISLIVCLASLYRNDHFETNDEETRYVKSRRLFNEMSSYSALMASKQFRLEYAKWCYENHPEQAMQEKAVALLRWNIENIDPKHIHSRTELGIIYQRQGPLHNLELSRQYLEECFLLEQEYHEAFRCILASTYIKMGDKESLGKARKLLEGVLRHNANNGSATALLLSLNWELDEPISSEELVKQLVGNVTCSPAIYINISERCIEKRQFDIGIQILGKAISSYVMNVPLLNQMAKLLREYSYYKPIEEKNMWLESVIGYLKKAEQLEEDNPRTLYMLIKAYDDFRLDEFSEFGEYLSAVGARNRLILKMWGESPVNSFLLFDICAVLLEGHRPRALLDLIESINRDELSPQDQIRLLYYKKRALIPFNVISEIIEADNIVEAIISQHGIGNYREARVYKEINFTPKQDRYTLNLYNVATLFYGGERMRDLGSNEIIQINFKIHEEINAHHNFYYASHTNGESERILVGVTEPYFELGTVRENLLNFIPNKLNIFS